MNTRSLSPYEQTQLARHGIASSSIGSSTKPIEYVTHAADFCGLEFFVDETVLIPRVETEGLVELTLQAIAEKTTSKKPISLLEVGTGSGAVIVSVAKHLVDTQIPIMLLASDISPQALAIAKKNQHNLVPESRIEWLVSDLLMNIPSQSLDMIVANLPYIPTERIAALDPSVKDFEPVLALDGGTDGFEIIKKLIEQSKRYLATNGIILLEVDSMHTPKWFEPWKDQFKITQFTDCYDRHRFIRLDLLPNAK